VLHCANDGFATARSLPLPQPRIASPLITFHRKNAMADDAKSPSQIADEARQAGRDAAEAASGIAGEALDTARGVAADAKDVASDAATTAKAYARNAVDESGKKITSLREQAAQWQASCSKQIAAEPVKSVLLAAAGGALLAGLLLAFDRPARRRLPNLRGLRDVRNLQDLRDFNFFD
jgi:ElaB/YqjD/DUF883 family membrane-anchored ribosome-binding protein